VILRLLYPVLIGLVLLAAVLPFWVGGPLKPAASDRLPPDVVVLEEEELVEIV
jgi:hypothetical protein